ncbi:ABC transporter substrate-binding protein [Verminephrobacter eiseniae]|nr:ABC transporter substrate-binding protein [Verminephrobacter sp. Larva24]MCW5233144.1 ABC transporter substrate-binding protein [Verminephrobacter eiseniae]MCW5295301.1 ABC transporter substrate-binding protein [Verminephrobacter eiseniae]MCW8183573.1 ABC transporter substrate-binding protein [Verminephrobacter eiseniae]MCW8224556.1 ABC transporter substrate-binding protein [Verminephrobacter eiseniae]
MKTSFIPKALLALSAAAWMPSSALAQDTVRFGVLLPLTGPAALSGTSIVEGMRLAAEEANAQGGVKGKKVQLFEEDDEGLTTKAVTGARRLVESNKVIGISGSYISAAAIAATKVAREFKVPVVSGGSTSVSATDANTPGDPWFFRAFPGSIEQGEQSARDIVQKLKAKKVAVIYENSPYGMSLAEQMRKDIPRFGGQVVAEEIYNTDERDFYSVLTKVRARQPEAIYLAGLMDAGVQVIRQAAEVGLKTQLVGSGSMMSDKLIQLTGNASEGFAVSSMFEPSTPNAFGQKFTRMFRERYKKEPDVFTALGYDSMHLLIEAARRAAKLDGEQLRAELIKMSDVPLVQGPANTMVKFDAKGGSTFRIGLAIVRNGKRVWLPFD